MKWFSFYTLKWLEKNLKEKLLPEFSVFSLQFISIFFFLQKGHINEYKRKFCIMISVTTLNKQKYLILKIIDIKQ